MKISLLSKALTPVFGPFAEVIARKIVDRKDDRGMGGEVAWIPSKPDTGGGGVQQPREKSEYRDSQSGRGMFDWLKKKADRDTGR